MQYEGCLSKKRVRTALAMRQSGGDGAVFLQDTTCPREHTQPTHDVGSAHAADEAFLLTALPAV
jgi:hypothetical protein